MREVTIIPLRHHKIDNQSGEDRLHQNNDKSGGGHVGSIDDCDAHNRDFGQASVYLRRLAMRTMRNAIARAVMVGAGG